MRWELPLLLLFSPLFLFPAPSRALPLLILPAIWIACWMMRREALPLTPFNGALALMALMVFVSVFATYDLAFSLPKIAGVVLGYGMFFAVVRAIDSDRALDIALQLFSIAGGALAILGILGTNWIAKVNALESVVARLPAIIRGVPGQAEGFQPNAIGGALVMFIPLQIARVFRAERGRFLHAAMLALTGGTLLLTQSRGAWLALAVALVAWAVWSGRRLWAAGVVLIAVVVAFAGGVRTGLASDVAGRLELWDRAILGIRDFPFTGMGMNTFRRVVMVLYPTFWTSPETDVAHAHNHLLQAALDLGVPGLIAYVALWIVAGMLLYRVYRVVDGPRRMLTGGVAAGLLAYFLFGTTDAIALGAKLGIFLWIALALVASMDAVWARERL